ncbi:MAG TPA: hypothetical protein VF319_05450 [Caldimonas sp.]
MIDVESDVPAVQTESDPARHAVTLIAESKAPAFHRVPSLSLRRINCWGEFAGKTQPAFEGTRRRA